MDTQPLLLVTTDPNRVQRLAAALGSADHQVVPALGGEAAAEALGVPGLGGLVLDLSLPGLDLAALRRSLTPAIPVPPDSLADAERRHIALALSHTRGNKRQAAILLGISRSTLLHKIRRYGLEEEAVRRRSAG